MKNYKIFQFLQEDNGKFSEQRLLCVIIVIAFIIDWMMCIFVIKKDFHPDYGIMGLIAGLMGIKAYQKKNEQTIDRFDNINRFKNNSIEQNIINDNESLG
jgi:hypothetical protein